MSPALDELARFVGRHPDRLCLVLFGPGFGESVLLRVPERDWIVVDGCEHGGSSFPARFLESIEARPGVILLTHPHEDHVLGLGHVLARADTDCVMGCYAPVLHATSIWMRSADPRVKLVAGTREHVLAAIVDRWENHPAGRWDLVSGSVRSVGDATLLALHPPDGASVSSRDAANDLCNAVLVRWRECRVLLGADLPAPGWESVASRHEDLELHAHHALKVPHHGSSGALHKIWTTGSRGRLWALTPWSRGKKLPRAEDGEGLDLLLGQVDEVHLTGLPQAHDRQTDAPCETTRQDLAAGRGPVRRVTAFFPGIDIEEIDTTPVVAPRCWIAAAFVPDGTVEELAHGPGSVIVRDATRLRRSP